MAAAAAAAAVPVVSLDRVLLQAAPHPDPPYLGRCSLSFLRPPDIDFVLRPMRAFDVMEVRRRAP